MGELQADAVALLAELVRFDTVNPPGNERTAMEFLHGALESVGFSCELLAPEPERPNLVARLRGAEKGPTLCYLGHVDTVLADPGEWTHGPWSGDVADGFLYGRGAIDMKSQVAAEAAAAISLARSGWRPARGELLLVFLVDEETGGALGAQWITQNHPEAVRCDLLVNEGSGSVFTYDGKRFYGVATGEKGVFRFTLRTGGVAAHASNPRLGDNALLKLAPLIARLGERQPPFDPTPEPRELLSRLGALDGDGDLAAALERVRAQDAALARLIEPMLGITVTPTQVAASEKINVIPSHASLRVDCRVPPGLGEDHTRGRILDLLGPDGYELSFDETVVGNSSPHESALMDEISTWIAAQDPGAEVVPMTLAGFTDSRWFRAAFPEVVAYGFFPHRHMTLMETAPLLHAADERIDVRDLGFAAAFFRDLALRVLG